MGIFGPKKRGSRAGAKVRTGKERLDILKARYLESMAKGGDGRFDRYMEQQLGLAGEKGELERLADSLDLLKRVGLIQDPTKLGEGDLLKDALTAIGLIGRAFVTGEAPDGAVQEALGGGAPRDKPQGQLPAQAQAQAQEQKPMNIAQAIKARAIRAMVQKLIGDKAPGAAAELLIEHRTRNEVLGEIVQGFVVVEDGQMQEFMEAIVRQHPEFAPTVAWLAERPEWFWQCVYEVRARLQPPAQSQPAAPGRGPELQTGGMGL